MKYITQFNAERGVWCIQWLEESNASSYIVEWPYLTYEKREVAESKCLQLNKEKDEFLASFDDQLELGINALDLNALDDYLEGQANEPRQSN